MNDRQKIPVYSIYPNSGHSPLALGMLVSYARTYRAGLLNDSYEFVPQLLNSIDEARRTVAVRGEGILLCSDYMWSEQGNHELSEAIRNEFPGTIAIHGGPSVPKYDYAAEEFFAQHPAVDIAVRGEGEVTLAETLERLASTAWRQRGLSVLGDVAGLSYRWGNAVIRTPERPRATSLDEFPSPYLSGWFSEADAAGWYAAILESNRGCPYGCTFCDWGSATLSKVRPFALERIREEIEWVGKRGIGVLWLADANFGIWPRDVEIARMIAAVKQRYGYPRELVVNYAKHATDRLAAIVQILCDAGVAANAIISIQTQDPETLRIIKRSNISTNRYEDLIGIFKRQRLPVTSDLMLGLPGTTVSSFKSDLQYFFDRWVYAKVYPTFVLPNSPMAHRDYREAYQITTDAQGKVLSTVSFTAADRRTMEAIRKGYQVFVGYGMLRYVLYYLQADHGVPALETIDALQQCARQRRDELPRTVELLTSGRGRPWERAIYEWSGSSWREFGDEVTALVQERFGIVSDSGLRAVMTAQLALMPQRDRVLPDRVLVAHDVVTYFARLHEVDNVGVGVRERAPFSRLVDYGPCAFEVTDDDGVGAQLGDAGNQTYDPHRISWELSSPLNAHRGVAHFFKLPAAGVSSPSPQSVAQG